MMKKFLFALIMILLLSFIAGCGSDNKSNTASSTSSSSTSKKEITLEQKKQASAEIIRILNSMPQQTDEVEKLTWYKPWGSGGYPAQDAVYWYAGKKNDSVWMRAKIVNFTSSTGWVFWDKITFSTADKNIEYKIKDCFAGQSGGGKSTQIVYGGKYETLDVPFSDLDEGYRLLVNGKNPIIRLTGREHYYDYRLTENDINHLKTGIYLFDQMKVTGDQIIK